MGIVANKGSARSYRYALAFIVGIILMVIVYLLFEPTTKRARSGSEEPVDTETSRLLSAAARSSMVQTAGDKEAAVSPSAFLGVEIIAVDSVIAEQLGISDRSGVLINSVVPESPAAKAGLERGDVIIALNNRTVKDVDRFKEVMSRLNPGDAVRIVFMRNGRKDLAYAELAEAPAISRAAQEAEPGDSRWGASLSAISSDLRASLAIPPEVEGVVILSVVPGGRAARAGLMPGDVITGIDRTPISDMDDLFRALSSDEDDTALLDVYTQGRRRYVPVDSSALRAADQTQSQTTLRQRIFSIFTGGAPFAADEDEEEGPKGGKFAQDNLALAADNSAFNRPSTVPGDENTGGAGPSGITGMNRPATVPSQSGGPVNDVVLFVGLLLIALIYLAYREFHRAPEPDNDK